mmetsp:Transcript_6495/g.21714  ORF Transcript_6495/g.21714 Transcript_6495/m.21714 type:complete len:216 (-) Transcript_6495:834-1481(-)
MTGKEEVYLSALKRQSGSFVSWYCRRHCARRIAYGTARQTGICHDADPHRATTSSERSASITWPVPIAHTARSISESAFASDVRMSANRKSANEIDWTGASMRQSVLRKKLRVLRCSTFAGTTSPPANTAYASKGCAAASQSRCCAAKKANAAALPSRKSAAAPAALNTAWCERWTLRSSSSKSASGEGWIRSRCHTQRLHPQSANATTQHIRGE